MSMQQQPAVMPAYAGPGAGVSTNLIQQYLDENKQLIVAILEGQSAGKTEECAMNQAKLQRNLMYLAAIADSQSQAPNNGTPTTSRYGQAQQMTPPSAIAARTPMLYSQSPLSATQQQHTLHSQMVLGSGGATNNGFHMLYGETPMGLNNGASAGVNFTDLSRNFTNVKQDIRNAGTTDGLEHTGN